jgi:hypothetical protein
MAIFTNTYLATHPSITDLVADLNTLLGVLDGVTAGTSKSSKAVVLSSSGKINTIDLTAVKFNGVSGNIAFLGSAKTATTVAALSSPLVTAEDATTATTSYALGNANKVAINSIVTKVNDIVAKLKTSGIIA